MSTRPTPRRRATITDVAAHAGVSHQTVSRVINGSDSVSPDTRSRVESAIAQLDYTPSPSARALASQRSDIFGVLAVGTDQYGPRQVLTQIEATAPGRGYTSLAVSATPLDPRSLSDALDELRARQVAGAVVLAPVDLPAEPLARMARRVPIVVVDAAAPVAVPSTAIDQVLGARLAAEHLVGLGHRRFATVAGPDGWHDAALRAAAWQAVLGTGSEVVEVTGDWSASSGARAIADLAASGVAFGSGGTTAVLCGNDTMALGALHQLDRLGLRVPDDVSVAGFDDVSESAYFLPALTTVRQDFRALADATVDHLLALVEGVAPPGPQVIAPELVVRASTGPAPI